MEEIIEMINNDENTWSILDKLLALTCRKYGSIYNPYKVNIQHKSCSISEQSYTFGVTFKAKSEKESTEEAIQECIRQLILHYNEER